MDPRLQLVIFWDFGVSDETAVILGQVTDEAQGHTRWLDEIVASGKDWKFYHRQIIALWYTSYLEACGWTPDRLKAWAARKEFDWTGRSAWVCDFNNEVPRGCLPVYHAGDPAGKQRDSSLSSWTRNLAMGDPPMTLQTVPFARPEDGSLLDWIDHTRQIVRHDGIVLSSFCTRLADALAEWPWPTDRDGNVLPGRHLPVHDKHSHLGTALVMGYRTRWRGALVPANTSRAAAEMAVTADHDSSARWTPEPTGRGRARAPEPMAPSDDPWSDDGDDDFDHD